MSGRIRCSAIAFTRPCHAELRDDVQMPEMDDHGVVLRTIYSGLSRGTELDLYEGQMHSRPPHSEWYPILPGYMPVGEVIEAGGAVEHLKPGDIAVSSNLFSGFDERYCPAWAGHSEYVVISKHSHGLGARRAVKVPEGLAPRTASVALLAAVAYHGTSTKVLPQGGETILVIGQGGIGNAAAQLCKLAGCRVIVADKHEVRLQASREAGIEHTINVCETNLWDAVGQLCRPGELRKVIEVTGEPASLEDALRHGPNGGLVHAQGMYLDEVRVFMPQTLFGHNLSLTSTCGETPEMMAAVLELMARGDLKMDHLITRTYTPDQATEAYDWSYRHPDEGVTLAFQW